ncbi:MAG: DegV family protein [Clostridia bacterium]|nr:DegV family protein [Clostridia bacterium]
MRIVITSDSTCDLSDALIEQYKIKIIPLYVVMEGKSLLDTVNVTPKDIFDYTDRTGKLCGTAARSIGDYADYFAPLSREYDAVVHISISSGFSSCFQNATLAAEDFDNVYVVNSKNLSTGHGHVVLEAARLAENCTDVEKMVEELNEFTGRVEASFVLDRLDYMVKGGRCSMVAALGANLLKLKPGIEVVDGKMQVAKKYRGSYIKCLEAYVKDKLDGRDDIIYDKCFLTYTTADPEEVEAVRAAMAKYANFETIYETTAGCTVGCHCGPKTLGILFIRKR